MDKLDADVNILLQHLAFTLKYEAWVVSPFSLDLLLPPMFSQPLALHRYHRQIHTPFLGVGPMRGSQPQRGAPTCGDNMGGEGGIVCGGGEGD